MEAESKSSGWAKARARLRIIAMLRTQAFKAKVHDFRQSRVVLAATVRTLATVPFHMQGRLSFNTDAAIEQRMMLRRRPEIIACLELWWRTAQRTQMMTQSEKEEHFLSKEQYVVLSCKLYRAMVEVWDENDALAVAEEEWSKDAADGRMGKELFMDSIFEFADMNTLTVRTTSPFL